MCPSPKDKIKKAATTARNLLGQLGPAVWALHARHYCVGDTAELIAENPNRYVRVGPGISGKVRNQAVKDIGTLIEGGSRDRTMFSSTKLREVINRNIVVYAVTVLEQFLDETGKELWETCGGREQRCGECRRYKTRWPADSLGKIAYLDGRRVKAGLRGLDHYVNTGWLILVRNAIIHSDGKAVRSARDACQYKLNRDRYGNPSYKWKPGKGGDGQPTLVWDDANGKKPTDDWKERTFSIGIDHFILPRLRDSQAFVEEAARKLCKAAGHRQR